MSDYVRINNTAISWSLKATLRSEFMSGFYCLVLKCFFTELVARSAGWLDWASLGPVGFLQTYLATHRYARLVPAPGIPCAFRQTQSRRRRQKPKFCQLLRCLLPFN